MYSTLIVFFFRFSRRPLYIRIEYDRVQFTRCLNIYLSQFDILCCNDKDLSHCVTGVMTSQRQRQWRYDVTASVSWRLTAAPGVASFLLSACIKQHNIDYLRNSIISRIVCLYYLSIY